MHVVRCTKFICKWVISGRKRHRLPNDHKTLDPETFIAIATAVTVQNRPDFDRETMSVVGSKITRQNWRKCEWMQLFIRDDCGNAKHGIERKAKPKQKQFMKFSVNVNSLGFCVLRESAPSSPLCVYHVLHSYFRCYVSVCVRWRYTCMMSSVWIEWVVLSVPQAISFVVCDGCVVNRHRSWNVPSLLLSLQCVVIQPHQQQQYNNNCHPLLHCCRLHENCFRCATTTTVVTAFLPTKCMTRFEIASLFGDRNVGSVSSSQFPLSQFLRCLLFVFLALLYYLATIAPLYHCVFTNWILCVRYCVYASANPDRTNTEQKQIRFVCLSLAFVHEPAEWRGGRGVRCAFCLFFFSFLLF